MCHALRTDNAGTSFLLIRFCTGTIGQWCRFLQEWANANCVALPVRNDRANTTSYYRFEEEVPSNILQAWPPLSVRSLSCSDQGTSPMRTAVSHSTAPV